MLGIRLSLLYALTHYLGPCIAACSSNAVNEARKCLADLSKFGGTKQLTWTYERTNEACKGGKFTTVVRCMKTVEHNCRHDRDNLDRLHGTVNVVAIEQAFTTLCNDLPELKRYEPCLRSQRPAVQRCLERLKEDTGSTNNMEYRDRMEYVCATTDAAYMCQISLVRQRCGTEPAQLLIPVMKATRPPSCSRGAIDSALSSSVTTRLSNFVLSISVILVLFVCRLL